MELPSPSGRLGEPWLNSGGGGARVSVAGLEALFDPARVHFFTACSRAFMAFIVTGALFYVASFVGEWGSRRTSRGADVGLLTVLGWTRQGTPVVHPT